MKRKRLTAHTLTPYLFLSPYLVLALVFFVVPLLKAIPLAFYQTNGPRSRLFIGFENFWYLLQDPVFHKTIVNVTSFAVSCALIQIPAGLALAMLLNVRRDRMKGLFRLILVSPQLVGPIFVGILFTVLYTPRYGMINNFLQSLVGWGLEKNFLSDPHLAMAALVATNLWIWTGMSMVYYLAALQGVDQNLIEAARVDGAGPWQVFRHVIVPSIRHVTLFLFITSFIGSYQLYELPLTLFNTTGGRGPDDATYTMVGYLYEAAFNQGDLGLGSAVGWVLTAIIMAITFVQIKLGFRQRGGMNS